MARMGTKDATVTPRARYCPRLPGMDASAPRVPHAQVIEIVQRCPPAAEQPFFSVVGWHKVRGQHAANEVQPFGQRALGPAVTANREVGVGDERTHQKRQAEGAAAFVRGRLDWQVLIPVEADCAFIAAAFTQHERAKGQPAQSLIPGKEIAVQVTARQILLLSPAHNAQFVNEAQPVGRVGVGKARHQRRVGEQRHQLFARKRRERQVEQHLRGLGQPVPALWRQIDNVVGQLVAFGKDCAHLRKIGVLARLGHNDRDVVAAQIGLRAQATPDLGRHHFQFAADAWAGQYLQTAIGAKGWVGLGSCHAIEDVVLQTAEQRGCG
jgi:hypothetical protein